MRDNCLRWRIPINFMLFNLAKGLSIYEILKNIAVPAAIQYL